MQDIAGQPTGQPSTRNAALRGLAWMTVSTSSFAVLTGLVFAVGTRIPSVESTFLRYLFGMVMLLPLAVGVFRRLPPTKILGLHVLRAVFHSTGAALWFFAMARVPLAEVTALGYVAPIVVTIGAAIFFGEKLHIRRITAVMIGFVGAIVVLRPGFQEITIGHVAQLGAAPLFACSFLVAKKLTATEQPIAIVVMLSAISTVLLAPPALAVWVTPTPQELGWLVLAAATATFGHYAMTRAFEAAPLTVTQPANFLQLVWASLIGWVVFGQNVDAAVFIGGAMIVGATTFIARREALAARRALQPSPDLGQ